jgi:hypothetical protein
VRSNRALSLAGAGARSSKPAGLQLEHFQVLEKHALAKAGVESGFPSENATTAKMLERFLSPVHVKPL